MAMPRLRNAAARRRRRRAGALPPPGGWAVLTRGEVRAVFPTLGQARWFAAEFYGREGAEIRAVPLDPAQ